MTDVFDNDSDKPMVLKAIELILADPKDIQNEAISLKNKYIERYKDDRTMEEIEEYTVDKIISNYSYYAGFAGAATGLTSVVPGLGQVISIAGGSVADCALSMKYQIEMTMAIAAVYGHNLQLEETKRICFLVAGLGALSEVGKKAGKEITQKAFITMVNQYLKGSTLIAVKEVFKQIGITFTKSALTKAIPFGISSIIGFSANKGLTWYVGTKAVDFFEYNQID